MKVDTLSYMQVDQPGTFRCKHPKTWRVVYGKHLQGCRLCGKRIK